MAKAKKRSGKTSKRKNPSNPRRRNPTRGRRRRNPGGSAKFSDRFLKLSGAAVAAVAGGVISYVGMSKLAQYGQAAEYAVPAAMLLTGAALAKSHPLLGAGIGIGAVAPFVPMAASKVLALMPAATPTTPATTTAGLQYRMARQMGAVQMGAVQMSGNRYANVYR